MFGSTAYPTGIHSDVGSLQEKPWEKKYWVRTLKFKIGLRLIMGLRSIKILLRALIGLHETGL